MCLQEQGQGIGGESGISWGQLPFYLQKSAAEHWGKRVPMDEASRHTFGAGCNPRIRVWHIQPVSWQRKLYVCT